MTPFAFDFADGLIPHWYRHRTFAVLRAYFDESGIHASSKTIVLSGWIGSRNQWRRVAHKWQKIMKGRVFHHTKMRFETSLLERLAVALDESGLEAVTGGFMGDWNRAINSGPADWPTRFPSCYQFILEMCVQRMEQHSKLLWNGEPIALIFSRQEQYANFAEEIWRHYKASDMWPSIVGFGYGDPAMPELQAADMIAYEVFHCTREVYEFGKSAFSPEVLERWPLTKRLVASGKLMLGSSMSEWPRVQAVTDSWRRSN